MCHVFLFLSLLSSYAPLSITEYVEIIHSG